MYKLNIYCNFMCFLAYARAKLYPRSKIYETIKSKA